jgi:hypothetical protein
VCSKNNNRFVRYFNRLAQCRLAILWTAPPSAPECRECGRCCRQSNETLLRCFWSGRARLTIRELVTNRPHQLLRWRIRLSCSISGALPRNLGYLFFKWRQFSIAGGRQCPSPFSHASVFSTYFRSITLAIPKIPHSFVGKFMRRSGPEVSPNRNSSEISNSWRTLRPPFSNIARDLSPVAAARSYASHGPGHDV